ncbi:TetR family transcriptional regulator [Massilia sp. RP-1-19]|uniref:TetR family transcriptional regulator n=2 Tax=Massilia polaris TaxID=2728846 RepID=A0A848HUH5_9BURK|nr:TetR family transcriptional regulator [Massilia polaris]
MRYEKGRKDVTRNHIIEVASRRFLKDGIAASGLAGIMADAGLTNGAFYPHFDSKESLVAEVVSRILDLQRATFTEKIEQGGIEEAIRYYLSMDHLEQPALGCPSAAFVPEIARASIATRAAFQSGLSKDIGVLAKELPGLDRDTALQQATSLFSLMLGTLQIARTVLDPDEARNLLKNGVESALQLIRMRRATAAGQ